MGMFNWVNFEVRCPVCGRKLTNFQTKDLEKELNWVGYKRTKNFYTYCEVCGTSIHFYKIKNHNTINITATYKMEIFESEKL